MNRKSLILARIIFVLVAIYLAIDISHYFAVRRLGIPGIEGVISEYAYEAFEISVVRWVILILMAYSVYIFENVEIKISFLLCFFLFSWILFFTKGRGITLVSGSFVYNLGLMEIISVLSLIKGVSLLKGISIRRMGVLAMILVASSVIFYLLIEPIHAVEFINSDS